MGKNIVFRNKGLLSLIDLTTMGDSSKREDDSKIGKFDSGLKYAIALLYRNNINFEIWSGKTKFKVGSIIKIDEVANKSKELLTIEEFEIPFEKGDEGLCNQCECTNYGTKSNNTSTFQCEGIKCEETFQQHNKDCYEQVKEIHTTAFSPQLGYNWKLWMAFRELYSNTLDEGGDVSFIEGLDQTDYSSIDETNIIIYSCEKVENIIKNWNNYFLDPKLKSLNKDNNLKIYPNPEGTLKLYKQGILIYADKKIKARYCYDYKYASIDERRALNDKLSFEYSLTDKICYSTNKEFITDFLSDNSPDYYEAKLNFKYSSISSEFKKVVNCLYEKNSLHLYPSLKAKLVKCKDVNIGIMRLQQSFANQYESDVEVKPKMDWDMTSEPIFIETSDGKFIADDGNAYNTPEEAIKATEKEPIDIKVKRIASKYGIEVDYKINLSEIERFKVMADSYKKELYITEDFEEENMWELIKAIYSFNKDKDAIFKDFTNLKKL